MAAGARALVPPSEEATLPPARLADLDGEFPPRPDTQGLRPAADDGVRLQVSSPADGHGRAQAALTVAGPPAEPLYRVPGHQDPGQWWTPQSGSTSG